jgi:hypothetical protein
MVNRSIRSQFAAAVVAPALIVPWLAAAAVGRDAADPEAVDEARRALSGRAYPWYDAGGDDYRTITPPRPPSSRSWNWGNWGSLNLGELNLQDLGRLIVFVLLAAGLTTLILYVARTWQRRQGASPPEQTADGPARVSGSAARLETLPTGLEIDESDPMEAARLLRERGDLGRAVVLLFAHQLLTLDRLGMIRLAPGRTGRQLVRSIEDDQIRGPVGGTLRMFEAVYYGHREPSSEQFERLWSEAEALDGLLAEGAVR